MLSSHAPALKQIKTFLILIKLFISYQPFVIDSIWKFFVCFSALIIIENLLWFSNSISSAYHELSTHKYDSKEIFIWSHDRNDSHFDASFVVYLWSPFSNCDVFLFAFHLFLKGGMNFRSPSISHFKHSYKISLHEKLKQFPNKNSISINSLSRKQGGCFRYRETWASNKKREEILTLLSIKIVCDKSCQSRNQNNLENSKKGISR